MFDAQSDRISSTLTYVTNWFPSIQATAAAQCDTVSQPHAATVSMSSVSSLSPPEPKGQTTGESGNSGRSSSQFIATPLGSDDGHSANPPLSRSAEDAPKVSFEDLAIRYRQNQHKQARRKRLEHRLHATKVSMGISARLVRVGSAVQRGLVDRLKHDDKVNFIALYHTMIDLQESCDSAFRRHFHRQDLLEDWPSAPEAAGDRAPDFYLQLSPQSRADLIEILQLVRTDAQFIFERLCSLTPGQLGALVSSAAPSWESSDLSFSSASRSRNMSIPKRSPTPFVTFRDHVLAFERTDALSTLLFNVFAAPLDSDAPEARLRLDVWSSVCAKLITDGGSRFYPLIGHILAAWAMGSDWKAKPKFELYLMDILQTGAFLLEHVDTPSGLGFDVEPPDPLRTDVAEEFFASAVDALFHLLDDPDGGLPRTVMELSSAILQKLDHQESRDRYLEFLFAQWFFSKYLYGALTYPEAHGLLLDFHIRKDAREKLLGQVGVQAYSQVFAVLRSMNHFSMARPTVRQHVEHMLNRFTITPSDQSTSRQNPPFLGSINGQESPAVFLMLSSSDILSLLNALFPTPVCNSPAPSLGIPGSLAFPSSLREKQMSSPSEPPVEPGFYRPIVDSHLGQYSKGRPLFQTELDFLSHPENCISRNADRIRFELSDVGEPDGRANLEPPAAEEWTVFSIAQGGRRLVWGLFSDRQSSGSDTPSTDEVQSTTLGMEDNFEALQTAIVKLIQENPSSDHVEVGMQTPHVTGLSLKQRFDRAMACCHHDSDFIGAHYWWNAARQLLRSVTNTPIRLADDAWILGPMYTSSLRSLQASRSVIDRCENDFVALDRHMLRLQRTVKDMMTTVTKLRDKMWYMTDVKNSMRYEDAKHVALALKTMVYSARLYKQAPNVAQSRGSTRSSLGGSLLQKPELQVMNIMKAPSSQGGPNKLSDEQVDLIRKWLSHNNIDNFCKGEERIHRFCYEVKSSINRLVGETMAETPVLWASELFHKERAKYEGSSNRGFLGLSSTLRPFSAANEDSGYSQVHGNHLRPSDSLSRYSQDLPSVHRKASFQSLMSDKWRVPRDPSIADVSSIGDSPGRAASVSTGDSCSTFWSTPHQPAYYAPSISSIYSRPPSILGDTAGQQPRRNDHKTNGKATFLDELRQTLTSLLLSDLGSPVWSCGSETDAWFGNALDQRRIQVQMRKRAQIQRFYTDYDERQFRQTIRRTPSSSRRSKSVEPPDQERHETAPLSASPSEATALDANDPSPFSYRMVFGQLIEVFSRHGNPFVKLKALRDLRALVIASLNSGSDDKPPFPQVEETTTCHQGRAPGSGKRAARHSFSESSASGRLGRDILHTPASPAAESVIFGSRPSDYSTPTEKQIVESLRDLLLEVKPKTLFRDLQFISAFVPGELLNKTDAGTAFLQFGLAALSLKDEICNSMVEIADNIVSQELSRRHPPPGYDMNPRPGHAIEDAAGMWIITAKEGNPVAQRELAILYLTHPELLPRVTLPLTLLRDTFKAEMMYRRDKNSKSDPQSLCLALHWMQLSANGGDELARNRLREREEFDSIA